MINLMNTMMCLAIVLEYSIASGVSWRTME